MSLQVCNLDKINPGRQVLPEIKEEVMGMKEISPELTGATPTPGSSA